jgi:hypothetical protein
LGEHENKKFTNQIQHLKVVILELHFYIETSELAQVAIRIGVLSTENWSNLEDAL